MASIQAELDLLKGHNVIVIGISADTVTQSQDLAARLGLTFPLLSDPDLKAARAFGVAMKGKDIAVPATFLVEPDGAISFRHIGETTTDRPALEAVLRKR